MYRWNKQKGDEVGKRFSKWNVNEPNLEDFDESIRYFSPLTTLAFSRCGNNPTFTCCTSTSECTYEASAALESSASSTACPSLTATASSQSASNTPTSSPFTNSQTIKARNSCTEIKDGTKKRCSIDTESTIFLNLQEVKRLTGTSKAACMALLGPNIDTTTQTQNTACGTINPDGTCSNDYDPTQPLFDLNENLALNNGYKKWIDLDCGRTTNSLMCDMKGISRSMI